MTNLLPGNHSEVVTTYINDVVQQLKTNPKVLPVVSMPALDSRGGQSQPGQDGHHRSPSATRRHKDDSDTRVSVWKGGGGGRGRKVERKWEKGRRRWERRGGWGRKVEKDERRSKRGKEEGRKREKYGKGREKGEKGGKGEK